MAEDRIVKFYALY